VLPSKVRKIGTTIAAVKFKVCKFILFNEFSFLLIKDGVVIGADSRCTEGNIIFDDNVLKIHRLSDNIYALGAGTSADCDFQTRLLESQLELLKLNQDRQVRVATAVRKIQQHLFRYTVKNNI
jgi:20S proteasome alpha/beta subunit